MKPPLLARYLATVLTQPAQAAPHAHWNFAPSLAFDSLCLAGVLADDPFFGRGARIMKATQREQDLKYELVVPICKEDKPTAITSCNYHLDHFGVSFDILQADGTPAHTACIGFGLERIALALLKTHGFDPKRWPHEVRQQLAMA
jgi:hypothetical protein